MKKFKIVSFVILLSCFSISCEGIIDEAINKVCEIGIKQVKEDYADLIKNVKNDPDLTQEEKDVQIVTLEDQRDEEIQEIKDEC